MSANTRVILLAVAVGLVLADSSVVTLGLPDILEEFGGSPESVSWVLISFNLVLALVAVPAGRLALRRDAGRVATVGLIVFAAASLACALAPSLGVLIAARCVQGLGGAAVLAAALDLLAASASSRGRGVALWGTAGAIGAAVGPAVGGALTDLLSWEAIFITQVPIAAGCLLATVRAEAQLHESTEQRDRPERGQLVALGLLSGGLAGALFLLVLLLVEGWGLSPLLAALVVSVMPASALAAGRLGDRFSRSARSSAAAGLVAGGLAALALLPVSDAWWTVPPQILIGLGLGLGIEALTDGTLEGRRPLGVHGGWNIAARHAGIVLALALVTPIFTADLDQARNRAELGGAALVLDADLGASTKLALALDLAGELGADVSNPDLAPIFAEQDPPPDERAPLQRLQERLNEQLDAAATTAFSTSFWVTAGLAALTLVPLLLASALAPLAAVLALAAGGALTGAYAVLDLGVQTPVPLTDPCEERREQGGQVGTLQALGLDALDGAACELGVSREALVLSLAGERDLPGRVTMEERNQAVRSALQRSIDEAQEAGTIGGLEAFALEQGLSLLSVDALLQRLLGR